MNKCKTCKYWEQNTFYEYDGAINEGLCPKLKSTLYIGLQTGWDGGYVDFVETESEFGCILHEDKE